MDKTGHFRDMLREREIAERWVEAALTTPDLTEDHDDGTRHYLKKIPEFGNRWLRVVVNIRANPNRAATVFFDRRLKGKK